jgi:hypothetical protein
VPTSDLALIRELEGEPDLDRSSELRRWWLALVALQVAMVWVVPVLPAQDLPQHLAYARILMDHHRADLPFGQLYELPQRFQLYFTTHYLLAGLGRVLTLAVAVKVVVSAYVAGMLLGFQALSAACAGRSGRRAGWPALLGSLVVWGPAAALGLLPFMLAMPALLFACARLVGSQPGRFGLIGRSVLTCLLHPVAGLCLALYAALHAGLSPSRGRATTAAIVVGCVCAVLMVAGACQAVGLPTAQSLPWGESLRKRPGLEFLDDALQIVWHDPLEKVTQVLAAALGPFTARGQLLVAAVLGPCAWLVWRARSSPLQSTELPARRAAGRAAIAFTLASWLAPSGIKAPTELLFVDLRMMHLSLALLLAMVDGRLFRAVVARRALVVASFFVTLHLGARALAFSAEARPALRLMARAQPRGMMLPLILRGHSASFGPLFRLTHFLPMYYTAELGGPSTQFWARYTDHLPVGYRPGRAPVAPPDWSPWEVRAAQLRVPEWVLLEAAEEDDPLREREATVRIRTLLGQQGMEPVECQDNWCLYRSAGRR